jgi:hypothetical protein
MEGSFSEDYSEARRKFLAAAAAAGAVNIPYRLETRRPDGGELSTDTAWLGLPEARNVLVTISGTHGVEGFFGSATQVELLKRSQAAVLPKDVAVLHVHAINPFGFAWLRRTNEDNIDVNRNWIDFDLPLPDSPAYQELQSDLCPSEWTNAAQTETGARLNAWIQRHGMPAFQKAVSGGQWRHAKGLFYGGTGASWSRRTLSELFTSRLKAASRVCVLDFHTGLGGYGYAEPIIGVPKHDPAFARIRGWIGAAAKSLYGDGSISAEIKGDSLSVLPRLLPNASVDCVALECGIRPVFEVANALRADAWLHAHGDLRSVEAKRIKAQLRGAFHSDDVLWQGMALGQGLAACQSALSYLLT